MAGRHKWSELRAKMSPERRERNEQAVAAMLAAMELHDLRQARGLMQEELARERAVRCGSEGNCSGAALRTPSSPVHC